MPVVESLKLVSFGRPRNVSWHPYAKRHLGCVRASIFPLPPRLCAVLCWKKSLNYIFSPFPWSQNYFFPTGNWRLCSNSTAGWSIGRCFGFQMGLSCWSQLLVFSYCLHPLGCCQWCSTSTCDTLGFGAGRRWMGWENNGEKLQTSPITLGKHWTDCLVIIGGIPIVRIGLYLFLDLFWAHKSIRRSH